MVEPAPPWEAVRQWRAQRIDTGAPVAEPLSESVGVAVELPLTIDIDGGAAYTLLCMPADREALVWGFLLTEGIINDPADLVTLRPCTSDPSVMRVRLAPAAAAGGEPRRNRLITSSCSLCGAEDLTGRLAALPEVGHSLQVDPRLLRASGEALRERQAVFSACGGTHGAAIFDAKGTIVEWAEDTGRHNALDKAIGKCLRRGLVPAGHGVVLTGRVSVEMVGKCARAGLELISAVSAPTSLGIEVAQRCGITLCAFVRETRATVFTHPERLASVGAGTP